MKKLLLLFFAVACSDSSSTAPPVVLDMASVTFKLDAQTCTVYHSVVLYVDGGQVSTRVFAPGDLSTPVQVPVGHHTFSGIDSQTAFKFPVQSATLSKDQAYTALLTC